MNKTGKIIISIFCLLVINIIILSACSTSSVRYVGELSYVEWRDDNGIFKFRAAKNGMHGCGTIILNGEEIPASYDIGTNKPYFSVNISLEAAEKLGYDTEYHTSGGVAFDGFAPNYSKSEKVITSAKNDVELFGVKIGKVRLKAYPVDKSEFAIWEIFSSWRDSENKLEIYNAEKSYVLNKCLRAYAKLPSGEQKKIIFRWLPETLGFCIYEYDEECDYPKIEDDTPILAEGTYEQDGNNVELYFTKDELLGLQDKSLYLMERA